MQPPVEMAGTDFELEFAESIDMFTDINMIGIGIVSFVRNILDSAEAFLVDAGKPVAQGFSRGSIQRESQSRFSTPLLAGRVEVLHDTHSKFLAFRCRVAASLHGHRAFIKADIPQRQRGVAISKSLSMVSPFFRRAMAPFCQWIGLTSLRIPLRAL